MKKSIGLAIGWGVFAVAFSRYAELFFDGWRILTFAQIVLAAPALEEGLKFLGYRCLRRYTLLLALAFAWAEILLKMATLNAEFPSFVGVEMLSSAILSLFGSITVIAHVATWTLPYLLRFKWWSYFLAVGVHSLWNFYFFGLYPDQGLRIAASPIVVSLIALIGIVLLKESFKLDEWSRPYIGIGRDHEGRDAAA